VIVIEINGPKCGLNLQTFYGIYKMAVVSMFAAIRNLQTKSGDFLVKVNISYRSRCNSAYTDHEEHVEYS